LDISSFTGLNLNHVRYYLESHGWTRTKTDERREIWTSVGGDQHVLVPSAPLDDFDQVMMEAVGRIGEEEDRDIEDVLLDLSWPGYDKLITRTYADQSTPAIPLDRALELNDALRDLVVAAARASEDPRPAYSGGWSSTVSEYIDRVLMIPTQVGSFTLRALLPTSADPPGTTLFDDVETPSLRAVTRTLRTATAAAVVAANRRSTGESIEVFDEVVSEGVSAGLLDAMSRLGGETESPSSFEMRVAWTYGGADADLVPLRVPEHLIPVLEQGATHLRGTPEVGVARITGRVVRLHRDAALGAGDITIRGFIDAGVELPAERNVLMQLDEQTYNEAVVAHQSGQTVQVQVEARFERRIRVTRMIEFTVLPNP
jgi:hypothetical protein